MDLFDKLDEWADKNHIDSGSHPMIERNGPGPKGGLCKNCAEMHGCPCETWNQRYLWKACGHFVDKNKLLSSEKFEEK